MRSPNVGLGFGLGSNSGPNNVESNSDGSMVEALTGATTRPYSHDSGFYGRPLVD